MAKTNKILLVDDDESILSLLEQILVAEGYEITKATNGIEALKKIYHNPPHLIIMDLIMPQMSGDEIVRKLRNDVGVSHIPIIMLSGRSDIKTEIKNLADGVDDFIIKPFRPEELLAKVHSIIYRTYRGLDANPLTRLPGNNSIREKIEEAIHKGIPFAVSFLDLDNFKAFNDKYGFERGDEAINLTAQIIIKAVKEHCEGNEFIGHIGGDDFVIITAPPKTCELCQNIIEQFDKLIPALYDDEDRKKGYIISKNRLGHIENFPIMTLSIGIVTNERKKIHHSIKVSEIGNELKKLAKTFKKSNYVIDVRDGHAPVSKNNSQSHTVKDNNFPLFTNLKDCQFIFEDLQKFLKYQKELGVIYLNITPIDYSENYKNICDNLMENASRLLFESQERLIRKKDIISIYNDEKDKIFVYLSPSRSKVGITSENIEKVLSRIEQFFYNDIKKEFNEDFKANIMLGYSLINFPFRCINILDSK